MTLLFAGGEISSFIPADSSVIEEAVAGRFNSSFSRCAIMGGSSVGSYAESSDFAAETDGWVHAHANMYSYPSGTNYPLILMDGLGVESVRLAYDMATDALSIQYLNASAVWTTAGSAITILLDGGHDIDLNFSVNSASGVLKLYVAGTLRITATGLPLGHIASITNVRQGPGFFGPRLSQVVVSTTSTIGGRLFTVPINGAGSDSAWTGTYLNIDEIVYSDADFINSDTANEVSTFAVSAPSLTGYQVLAVAVAARAKRGASGPQNLQIALRSSGTNYFSGSNALDVGYGAFVNIWETDPATGAAWVNAAVASLQPGVKSIA